MGCSLTLFLNIRIAVFNSFWLASLRAIAPLSHLFCSERGASAPVHPSLVLPSLVLAPSRPLLRWLWVPAIAGVSCLWLGDRPVAWARGEGAKGHAATHREGHLFAQLPAPSAGQWSAQNPTATPTLYVNAITGNDAQGNGSEAAPLRTLTQALKIATPSTVIRLAPGTYSAATGELFPLLLKPGVIVQGNAETRGQAIVVRGGGCGFRQSLG
jgi:hypothetical protein